MHWAATRGCATVGCSMQGIITNILQRMKSASHSTISALVYQGEGTLVISARVFHGSEIFIISSTVSFLITLPSCNETGQMARHDN